MKHLKCVCLIGGPLIFLYLKKWLSCIVLKELNIRYYKLYYRLDVTIYNSMFIDYYIGWK
jgi:hypothetical protein